MLKSFQHLTRQVANFAKKPRITAMLCDDFNDGVLKRFQHDVEVYVNHHQLYILKILKSCKF